MTDTRYSIAIRTLGLNPELLRMELESIYSQSVMPERVIIYIARGYEAPRFRVGNEEYVTTDKGMVAQRAVDYAEVDTPLIMLLDDDVILGKDSAATLIKALTDNRLDCISPDTFANHKMSFKQKAYAAITNFTFPHNRDDYAFRIKSNGSFNYINNPTRGVYMSQSAAGPCALWRTETLRKLRFKDELWLDRLGFAYNDDQLEFYKLYCNGGRLGVLFDAKVHHVGGKTASGAYQRAADAFARRATAMYLIWRRSVYDPEKAKSKKAVKWLNFWFKMTWGMPIHIAAAIKTGNAAIPLHYLKGLYRGLKFSNSAEFRDLPPYILESISQ